jgi:hypothetical protein
LARSNSCSSEYGPTKLISFCSRFILTLTFFFCQPVRESNLLLRSKIMGSDNVTKNRRGWPELLRATQDSTIVFARWTEHHADTLPALRPEDMTVVIELGSIYNNNECFTRRGTTDTREPPRYERYLGKLFGRGVDLPVHQRAYRRRH